MSEELEDEAQSSGLGFDPPPESFGGPLHVDLVVDHILNIAKYKGAVFVAFGALGLLMLGLICLAFQLKDESFGQELSIVFAAGIATFLGAPLVVTLSSKRRRYVIPIIVLLALGCGFWAFLAEGLLRALLVEEHGLGVTGHGFGSIDNYEKDQ